MSYYQLLYINDFDPKGYEKKISLIEESIQKGEWIPFSVKKLSPYNYYRVSLDDKARLIFQIGTLSNTTASSSAKYLLVLEVLAQHEYDKSRFLKGKTVVEEDFSDSLEQLQTRLNLDVAVKPPSF